MDTTQQVTQPKVMEGAGFTWVLEHLLTYPGTYEIPLRTMYSLNCSTQTPQKSQSATALNSGNALPRRPVSQEDPNMSTQNTAAQLKSTLVHHISQLPSQPTSLPPNFISTFVRRCFPSELDQVDFPQALTALDYLKDLEVRRRREVVAALSKLGIAREDLSEREKLAKNYPGVMKWIEDIEDKERKVEALYTQIYIGIRRWTMINELSLEPLNKANCIAMLNTLYPPTMLQSRPFVQPSVQLTTTVLSTQRQGFFRYITAVERNGPGVLGRLMEEHRRQGEMTGWPSLRETLDNYLRMANSIIDESYEVSGNTISPTSADFSFDDDGRRKVDSGISFGSNSSSNRNSAQSDKSHATRPSTSSSVSAHSRKTSREKQGLSMDEDTTITFKSSGSTLDRIARELKRMKSRSSNRDLNSRKGSLVSETEGAPMADISEEPQTAGRQRTLSLKRSLRNMRSKNNLRDEGSRPVSRADDQIQGEVPVFDAEEMRRRRMIWEAQQSKGQVEN